MSRLLKWALATLAGLAVLVVALAYGWLQRPLPLEMAGRTVLDVTVPPGTTARGVARALREAGVTTPESLLFVWLRLSGQSRSIQAGSYELAPGVSPRLLLDMLVRGEQAVRRVTLVEGWNYRQVLQALRKADSLVYDLPEDPTAEQLVRAAGLDVAHPEGRFFPDTYLYPKNAKASTVLQQAARAMDERLAQVWAERAAGVPLRSPDEALILASIIEKETGQPNDRPEIAGVFANRLRMGMRLQTDPTVMYGVGPDFAGRLRRSHLDTDTPYNTYTRAGLPPTPIAMPGLAALRAAVQPAATRAIYFVSRGDGSSHFSLTLDEHNQAVRRYILNR